MQRQRITLSPCNLFVGVLYTFKVFSSNSIWMVGMIGLFAWLYESVHKSWYLHCTTSDNQFDRGEGEVHQLCVVHKAQEVQQITTIARTKTF